MFARIFPLDAAGIVAVPTAGVAVGRAGAVVAIWRSVGRRRLAVIGFLGDGTQRCELLWFACIVAVPLRGLRGAEQIGNVYAGMLLLLALCSGWVMIQRPVTVWLSGVHVVPLAGVIVTLDLCEGGFDGDDGLIKTGRGCLDVDAAVVMMLWG